MISQDPGPQGPGQIKKLKKNKSASVQAREGGPENFQA